MVHFLNIRSFSPKLNETNIVLIPKKTNPELVTDLRPISLCNVIYKIISKVLENRLKKILPTTILDSQSAFVKDRQITDNTIMAFEVGHYPKRKTQGKNGMVALKADMSKTFNRFEWSFIRDVLTKLGFHASWVSLLMNCILSVNYNIVSNGYTLGPDGV